MLESQTASWECALRRGLVICSHTGPVGTSMAVVVAMHPEFAKPDDESIASA